MHAYFFFNDGAGGEGFAEERFPSFIREEILWAMLSTNYKVLPSHRQDMSLKRSKRKRWTRMTIAVRIIRRDICIVKRERSGEART